jgi:hypothetical protein
MASKLRHGLRLVSVVRMGNFSKELSRQTPSHELPVDTLTAKAHEQPTLAAQALNDVPLAGQFEVLLVKRGYCRLTILQPKPFSTAQCWQAFARKVLHRPPCKATAAENASTQRRMPSSTSARRLDQIWMLNKRRASRAGVLQDF